MVIGVVRNGYGEGSVDNTAFYSKFKILYNPKTLKEINSQSIGKSCNNRREYNNTGCKVAVSVHNNTENI